MQITKIPHKPEKTDHIVLAHDMVVYLKIKTDQILISVTKQVLRNPWGKTEELGQSYEPEVNSVCYYLFTLKDSADVHAVLSKGHLTRETDSGTPYDFVIKFDDSTPRDCSTIHFN